MDSLSYGVADRYMHSGNVAFGRFVIASALAMMSAAAVAIVYVLLGRMFYVRDHFQPIVYLVIQAACAAALGGLMLVLLKFARVRSTLLVCVMAILIALAMYYMHWVFWSFLHLRRYAPGAAAMNPLVLLGVIAIPDMLWSLIRDYNLNGTWTYQDSAVRGWALWVLWACEAMMLIGVSASVPIWCLLRASYCEACNAWTRLREGLVSLAGDVEPEVVTSAAQARDLDALESLGWADFDAPRRYRLDIVQCDRCHEFFLFSVVEIRPEFIQSGTKIDKKRILVDRLRIVKTEADRIATMRDRIKSPMNEEAMEPSAEEATDVSEG